VRKQDCIRKDNKKKSALTSTREMLTSIAHHLYSIYKFETRFYDPTIGDVMEAAQFKSLKAILDHFSPKANNKTNIDSGDIRDFYTKDQWIYLIQLNSLVNADLHSSLARIDGKTTIVLPSGAFKPELAQGLLEPIGFDAVHLDIKNVDSDSSTGVSPDKKVVT
jgi:hypothetical protein